MFRPLVIVAVILGVIILRHFEFKTLTFKDPWLDALYILVFAVVVFLLFRSKKRSKS